MTVSTHRYRAWYRYWVDSFVQFRTVELHVLGGFLTMDENWSPFVQAELTITTPDAATLALLDPRRQDVTRDAVRLEITETGGTSYAPTFLTVRELTPRLDGTTMLTVASKDVILQDRVWTQPASYLPVDLAPNLLNIVDNALFMADMRLEDADSEVQFRVYASATNRIPNAAPFNGADQWTRTGWRGIVNCANPNPLTGEGGTGDRYVLIQMTGPASGTANAVLSLHPWRNTAGALEGVKVEELKQFSMAVEVMIHTLSVTTGRTIRARLVARYYDQFGNQNWTDVRGDYVTLPQGLTAATGAYQRPTLSVTVPRGVQTMGVIVEFDGIRNGDYMRAKKAMLNDGPRIEPDWFHGSTDSTADYVYAFSGNAFESPSTRTALKSPDRDMLIWEPGVSVWDFLTAPLRIVGRRVWADGDGLVHVSQTRLNIAGAVSILEGVNLTDGSTSVDRGSDEFADNLMTRFKWTTRDGPQTASIFHTSGNLTGKTLVVDIEGYPDNNAGINMLASLRSKGRASEAQAVSKYDVRPGMALTLKLPDSPVQTGRVSSVRFDFDQDEMTIRGRDMVTAS